LLFDFLCGIREVHSVYFAGIDEALDVVIKAEDGCAFGCFIGPYAFKNR